MAAGGVGAERIYAGEARGPMWTNDGRVAFTQVDALGVPHVYPATDAGEAPALAFERARSAIAVDRRTGELLVHAIILDDGRVLAPISRRTGELFAVDAPAGTRF